MSLWILFSICYHLLNCFAHIFVYREATIKVQKWISSLYTKIFDKDAGNGETKLSTMYSSILFAVENPTKYGGINFPADCFIAEWNSKKNDSFPLLYKSVHCRLHNMQCKSKLAGQIISAACGEYIYNEEDSSDDEELDKLLCNERFCFDAELSIEQQIKKVRKIMGSMASEKFKNNASEIELKLLTNEEEILKCVDNKNHLVIMTEINKKFSHMQILRRWKAADSKTQIIDKLIHHFCEAKDKEPLLMDPNPRYEKAWQSKLETQFHVTNRHCKPLEQLLAVDKEIQVRVGGVNGKPCTMSLRAYIHYLHSPLSRTDRYPLYITDFDVLAEIINKKSAWSRRNTNPFLFAFLKNSKLSNVLEDTCSHFPKKNVLFDLYCKSEVEQKMYLKKESDKNILENLAKVRWLLVGPARTGTPMHQEPAGTAVWLGLLKGIKIWITLPKRYSRKYLNSIFFENDSTKDISSLGFVELMVMLKSYPQIEAICLIQEANEVVILPPYCWHAVFNLTETIAFAENFVFENFCRYLKTRKEPSDNLNNNVFSSKFCSNFMSFEEFWNQVGKNQCSRH